MNESLENALWNLSRKSARGTRYWLKETPEGLVSRPLRWLGGVMVGLGAALLAFLMWQGPIRLERHWVPLLVGGAFVLTGALQVLSRQSLEINWRTRTWREQRSFFVWSKIVREGTFAECEGIVLTRFRTGLLTIPSHFWVVTMELRGTPIFYDLFCFYREERARTRFEYLTAKTGLRAIDRTRESASRSSEPEA